MENKVCIKCGKEFPATKEYFRVSLKSKLGITLVCKPCDNERAKLYRANDLETKRANGLKSYHKNKHKESNRDRNKNYLKQYRELHKIELNQKAKEYAFKNKEHIKEYHKVYRIEYDKNNAEKIRLRKKEYRKQNLDAINKRRRDWHHKNPEKVLISKQRRNNRSKNVLVDFDVYDWQRCLDHFDNKCAYCGEEKKLAQDHFIALRWGGNYTKDNIVPACKSCNGSKSDRDFFTWYSNHKYYSDNRKKKILKYLGYNNNQLSLVI